MTARALTLVSIGTAIMLAAVAYGVNTGSVGNTYVIAAIGCCFIIWAIMAKDPGTTVQTVDRRGPEVGDLEAVMARIPDDMHSQLNELMRLLGKTDFRGLLHIAAYQNGIEVGAVEVAANALCDRLSYIRGRLKPRDIAGDQHCIAYTIQDRPHAFLTVAMVLPLLTDYAYDIRNVDFVPLARQLIHDDYVRCSSQA